MQIRFRCRHCKKVLGVKPELAGKKAKCPACKKPIVIPAPVTQPVDAEALAMAALADEPAQQAEAPQSIDFDCQFCGEAISMGLDKGGQREPCPSCKRIVRVPVPESKKDDWRTIKQTGPSGAMINQQEKLEGEWGTETAKGKVSKESLEEADAIIEVEEPVSVGKWIKRGVLTMVFIGAIVAAVYGFNRQQRTVDQKKSIEEVLACLKESSESKDPNVQLPPEWFGEIQRGLGEYYMRKSGPGMLDRAKTAFNSARDPYGSLGRVAKPSLDLNLLLIRVAESQVALGGSEDEEKEKTKIAWDNMPKQFSATVNKLQTEAMKAKALRRLAPKLNALNQGPVLISVIGQVQPKGTPKDLLRSPVHAQLIAELIELDQFDKAKEIVPEPDGKQVIVDLAARLGYTEGYARRGDFARAEELAKAPGPPAHQLQALLAIAEVAALKSEDQVKPLVSAAVDIKTPLPPWEALQLAELLAFTGDLEKAKAFSKPLDKQHLAWAEYAQFRAKLKELKNAAAKPELAEIITNQASLPRLLAWEDISRHNTRHGHRDEMKQPLTYPDDPRSKAFIYLGFALGEQDRE